MKKTLLALGIVVALGLRLVAMGAALRAPSRAVAGNDERVHDGLAASMLRGDGFTLNRAPQAARNITRVPVYPAFVAAVRAVAGARYLQAVVVVQNILALATGAILFRFVRPRWGSRAAWVALLLFLADVPTIVFSDLLLTEIPYLFLSVASMVLFVGAQEEGGPLGRAALAGAAAALAALCRPIHQYFPFLLAAVALAARRGPWRAAARSAALFLCVYLAGIAPWLVRNYRVYGTAELTHLQVVYAYLYKAGGALAVAEGRDIEEVKRDLEAKARDTWGIANINEDPRSEELLSFSRHTVARHPFAFAASTLAGFAGNALMPEKGALYGLAGRTAPRLNLLWSGNAPRDPWGTATVAAVGMQTAALLGIYAFIGWGFYSGRLRLTDFIVALSIAAVFYYYLAAAGPESTPRFRIPAVPYLCLLVAACVDGRGGARIKG